VLGVASKLKPSTLGGELQRPRVSQVGTWIMWPSRVRDRAPRLPFSSDGSPSYLLQPSIMRNMVAPYETTPNEGRNALLSQMRRGALEYCVLALLRDGERYGFELVRRLGDSDGLLTSEGTVYPLLSRLRRDGVVETTWRESTSGPPRRYYRLTRAGSLALEVFSEEWRRFRDAVDGLLEEER
jgi:PadR family transcriptional regulator PadR